MLFSSIPTTIQQHSPMASSTDSPPIASLPPEVLDLIFARLSPADRRSARQVNRSWRSILWANRYIANSTLRVNPSTLTSLLVLEQMKRPFRQIHVTTSCSSDGRFYAWLKKLLLSPEISGGVHVMKLQINGRDINILFDRRLQSYVFRNVTELVLISKPKLTPRDLMGINVDVQLPRLESLKVDSLARANYQLIQTFSRQIKRLVIQVDRKHELLTILSMSNLDRIEELAIGVNKKAQGIMEILTPNDFYVPHINTLNKLVKLEILDEANMFVQVFDLVISSSPNLTHLRVTGVEMNPNALFAANNLWNLEFLQLVARTNNPNWTSEIEFSFPELHTLILSPELMGRPGELPKLKTLAIINPTEKACRWRQTWGINALALYPDQVPTITKFYIRGVNLSCIDAFVLSTFPKSSTVLAEDRKGYVIGSLRLPDGTCPEPYRVPWTGQIEELRAEFTTSVTVKEPASKPCGSQLCYGSGGCVPPPVTPTRLSRFLRAMRRRFRMFGKKIKEDFASMVRRVQRGIFLLGAYGCSCCNV